MPELNYVTSDTTHDFSWRSLCKSGGVAALIAGVIFRRNIAAELGFFNYSLLLAGWEKYL